MIGGRRRGRSGGGALWVRGTTIGMLAGAILAAAVARATPPPEPGDGKAVLELADDGFLRGRLVAVAAGPAGHRETILWESPLFDGPLEFAVLTTWFVEGRVTAR